MVTACIQSVWLCESDQWYTHRARFGLDMFTHVLLCKCVTVHYTYCKFVDKKPVLVVVLFLALCREQFWKCYFKFLLVAWLDVYVRVMMILC